VVLSLPCDVVVRLCDEVCALWPELFWLVPCALERCEAPAVAALSAFPLPCFGIIVPEEPEDCSAPPLVFDVDVDDVWAKAVVLRSTAASPRAILFIRPSPLLVEVLKQRALWEGVPPEASTSHDSAITIPITEHPFI
jgi:hypothetical protein